MKVEIYYKNCSAPQDFEDLIVKQLDKLDKYFMKNPQAKVTVSKQRELFKVEISLHVNNTYLRSEKTGKDMRQALDLSVDTIEKQLLKYKEKLTRKDAKALKRESFEKEADMPVFNVVRNKKFALGRCSVDDAILEMEMMGHNFYLFLDEEDGEVCLVYKRNDGDYGLIRTKE